MKAAGAMEAVLLALEPPIDLMQAKASGRPASGIHEQVAKDGLAVNPPRPTSRP